MIADQIERNLTSTNEKLFVDKMYEFISYLKITHYISNVSLGGAVYYDFTSTETSRSIGGDLGFGCGPLQERVKLNVERHTGSSYGKCTQIGGMADVSRVEKNNQEGIVEYGLLPLYDLLLKDHTKTRRALSKAIGKYIKEKEKESEYSNDYFIYGSCIHIKKALAKTLHFAFLEKSFLLLLT